MIGDQVTQPAFDTYKIKCYTFFINALDIFCETLHLPVNTDPNSLAYFCKPFSKSVDFKLLHSVLCPGLP